MKSEQRDEKKEYVATYKERRYQLLFNGKTKQGERALLMFFDGSRKFWVNSSDISDIEEKTGISTGKTKDAKKKGVHKVEITNHEIELLLGALAKEASAYRAVTRKRTAFKTDKKLAKEVLTEINSLCFRLVSLSKE